jgi:hypothetical protein
MTTNPREIIATYLRPYEQMPFDRLKELAEEEAIITEEVVVQEKWWQIEINILFADKHKQTVVVSGSIDDGGWRALMPYNITFERRV